MPVSVNCNAPVTPFIGQPYSHALSASGGTGPYTFAITSGSLPPGLALASSGTIAGIPRTTGIFSFTAQATDSLSAKGSVTCSVQVEIPSAPLPGFALSKLVLAVKQDPHKPVRGAAQ